MSDIPYQYSNEELEALGVLSLFQSRQMDVSPEAETAHVTGDGRPFLNLVVVSDVEAGTEPYTFTFLLDAHVSGVSVKTGARIEFALRLPESSNPSIRFVDTVTGDEVVEVHNSLADGATLYLLFVRVDGTFRLIHKSEFYPV